MTRNDKHADTHTDGANIKEICPDLPRHIFVQVTGRQAAVKPSLRQISCDDVFALV